MCVCVLDSERGLTSETSSAMIGTTVSLKCEFLFNATINIRITSSVQGVSAITSTCSKVLFRVRSFATSNRPISVMPTFCGEGEEVERC